MSYSNPFKKPNRFSSTGYLNSVSNSELLAMDADEIFYKRVVIKNIFISNSLGRTIDSWLSKNPSFVVNSSKFGSHRDGGVSYSIYTSYFCLQYSYEDGCDEDYRLRPSYSGDKYPDSKSPTMIELWLGLRKKYPNDLKSIQAEFSDVTVEEHNSIMYK